MKLIILITLLLCFSCTKQSQYKIAQVVESNYSSECNARLITIGTCGENIIMDWQCIDILNQHSDLNGIKDVTSNEMINKLETLVQQRLHGSGETPSPKPLER